MLLQDPHCCHPSMPVGVSAAGEMLAVVVVSVLWVSRLMLLGTCTNCIGR